MHEPVVVVGADRRGARAVLTRARQVSSRAVVVSNLRELPADCLDAFDAVDVLRVDHLSLEGILRVARDADCGHVMVSGLWQRPARMLRQGIVAAAAYLQGASTPYLALHMVRAVPEFVGRPYRKVLVAADGAAGSGFAALVAAQVAANTSAELQVALLERRRDAGQRREVESRTAADAAFDVEAVRGGASLGNEALEQARRYISGSGVSASFGWLHADPATALLAAATTGGYGLMVSGLMGRQPGGRALGTPGTLTREVLEVSPVDHLVVFDSVSLGVSPPRRTAALVGATATIVLGLATVGAQQSALAVTAPGADAATATVSTEVPLDAPDPGTGWREARRGPRMPGATEDASTKPSKLPPPQWPGSVTVSDPDVPPPDDVPGPVVPGPDVPPPDDV
ncbi:MAG: hypothetical protein K1X95_10500, partial [Acidimicrobiia bacterium]|nr:hypothetical protein [Acidimicrobiia bacterium]